MIPKQAGPLKFGWIGIMLFMVFLVGIFSFGRILIRHEERNKIRVRIEPTTCRQIKNFIKSGSHDDDFVFKSRMGNTELSILQLNRILKKMVETAGVELKGRTFHSLRHTFITEGIKKGTPYGHMARQVDHEGKLGITGKYEHMDAKDLNIQFMNLDV